MAKPLSELDRLVGEILVGEDFELWFQSIYVRHEGLKRPLLLALAHTQELCKNAHGVIQGTSRHRHMGPQAAQSSAFVPVSRRGPVLDV